MAYSSPKIAIITMVQMADLPSAYASLSSLRDQAGAGIVRLVLVNDVCDPHTADRLKKALGGEVIIAGRNLGVASGRNLLAREAIARGAEYLLSIDDDIIISPDFTQKLYEEFQRLQSANCNPGIVTPATLDFQSVGNKIFYDTEMANICHGEPVGVPDTHSVLTSLEQNNALRPEAIYHMGIRDWRGAYFFSNTKEDVAIQQRYDVGTPEWSGGKAALKSANNAMSLIRNQSDPVEIDTAPGGICLYSAKLFQRLNGMNEAFNPFGYEDADFALRAKEKNYRHYCTPRIIALHDIDSRLKSRTTAAKVSAQGKVAGLLARDHLSTKHFFAALLVVTRRVVERIQPRPAKITISEKKLYTVEQLNALASYLGQTIFYLLLRHNNGIPDSEASNLSAENLESIFRAVEKLIVQGNRHAKFFSLSPWNAAHLFKVSRDTSTDKFTVSVPSLSLNAKSKFAPPLLRKVFGERILRSEFRGNFSLTKDSQFAIWDALILSSGRFDSTLAAKGYTCRQSGALNAIFIETLSLVVTDKGALAPVLSWLAFCEGMAPAEYLKKLSDYFGTESNGPLFDWLHGKTDTLHITLKGPLNGVPGPLQMEATFLEANNGKSNKRVESLARRQNVNGTFRDRIRVIQNRIIQRGARLFSKREL